MLEILGFRVKGTDTAKVENALKAARRSVHKALVREYHRMLSEEVVNIVDDIALNIVQKPDVPILQVAENVLANKLSRSGMGLETEYNMEVMAFVMNDGKNTYLMVRAQNQELIDALGETKGLEDYSVDSQNSSRREKWEELMKKYGDNPHLSSMTAIISSSVKLDTKQLKFPDVNERAKLRARHDRTNYMLKQYACGGEILPKDLMRLLDQALAHILDSFEVEAQASQLCMILPEITLELVQKDPKTEIPD